MRLNFTNESSWYARDLRDVYEPLAEGVLGSAELLVTAGATGLSVDVAAGSSLIQGDAEIDQGKYLARVEAATNSSTWFAGIPAAATNPRVDRVVLKVYDNEIDSSGLTESRLEVVAGVATAGATLSNLSGAAAVPGSTLLLANVLVPAGAASILAANIADKRIVVGDVLAGKEDVANKGQPSGYASLDAGGKVPPSELTIEAMSYKGGWNASTNIPALVDGTGNKGDLYVVTTAGARNLGSGSLPFAIGDHVIYDGAIWTRVPHSEGGGIVIVSPAVVVSDDFEDGVIDPAWALKLGSLSNLTEASGYIKANTVTGDGNQITRGAFTNGLLRARVEMPVNNSNTFLLLKHNGAAKWMFAHIEVHDTFFRGVSLYRPNFSAIAQGPVNTVVTPGIYWLEAEQTGNNIAVRLWNTDPALGGTPITELATTLAGADITDYGEGVAGAAGIAFRTTSSRIHDWAFTPPSGQVEASSIEFAGAGSVEVDLTDQGAGAALVTVDSSAPAADELGLRLLRGVVDTSGAGSIIGGSGFSILRNGVGDVTVTFTTAYAGAPAVTLSSTAASARLSAAPVATSFRALLFDATGAPVDGTLCFTVVGAG